MLCGPHGQVPTGSYRVDQRMPILVGPEAPPVGIGREGGSTERALAECEPAARVEVSFSAYGSYIFNFFGQDGASLDTYVDSWEFNNADQTAILVDGEDIINIDTLTDTTFQGTTSPDEDGFTDTFTFTRSN